MDNHLILTIHTSDSYSIFISQLNPDSLFSAQRVGGEVLRQVVRLRDRKELKTKMLKVFRKNVVTLSKEMQEILMDDLVTAFQSRMSVLSRVQEKRGFEL